MKVQIGQSRVRRWCGFSGAALLLAATLAATPATATTHVSAEPVPSGAVIGEENLVKLRGIGYSNLEHWASRLLQECRVVDRVLHTLSVYGAVTTINGGNTRAVVAAGGFEGITNPSFVLTLQDDGPNPASAVDVSVLSHALGYVLSQGGTAHFSPDNAKAYDFPLDYAVITFPAGLSGTRAKAFFEFVGTVNPALWSGMFAGFTQVDYAGSPMHDSMLFLQPAVNRREFVAGLSTAAALTDDATYATVTNGGQPTTARAGVAFPENDWIAYAYGEQYLARLPSTDPQLLDELSALRQQHLSAVVRLLAAAGRGNVAAYLAHQFRCE